MSGKLRKIVESKAAVSGAQHAVSDKLAALLSRKELATLEPELGLFRQACAMLSVKLLALEPGLAEKAAKSAK